MTEYLQPGLIFPQGRVIENGPQARGHVRRVVERGFAVERGVGALQRLQLVQPVRRHLRHARQALAGELPPVRVEPAALHEARRLFRATAGVEPVHEPAFALHELIEIAARPRQQLTEIVGRNVHDFAAGLALDAEDFTQDERQPLAAVEAHEHGRDAAELRLLHQEAMPDREERFVRQPGIGTVIERLGQVGERHAAFLHLRLAHVEEVIDRDAVEPGAELAAPRKRAEVSDGLQQNFLRRIFGRLPSPDHAQGQVEHPRLMAAHQLIQRLQVPGFRRGQQTQVFPRISKRSGRRRAHARFRRWLISKLWTP